MPANPMESAEKNLTRQFSKAVLMGALGVGACAPTHKLNPADAKARFLAQFKAESFGAFAPFAFLAKPAGAAGEQVVFVLDNGGAPRACPYAYVLQVDARRRVVSQRRFATEQVVRDSSCLAPSQQAKLEALAWRFLRYEVPYLAVDAQQNVFIRTTPDAPVADLVQLNNGDSPGYAPTQYRRLTGNWYVRK